MKNKISEIDVAKPIVSFLQQSGWEVYKEVMIRGGAADIIAKSGKLLWAIETKTSLSMEVIGQAYNWRDKCHFCSVGVPRGKHNAFSETILKKFEIGCIEVYGEVYNQDRRVTISVDSPFHRKVDCNLVYRSLKEEQKTFSEAGSTSGNVWTPFKETVRNLIDRVRNNPGIEFKDLIRIISHHYSSYSAARNSLKKWIECGVIKEIILKNEDGKLKCFLDKNKNEEINKC